MRKILIFVVVLISIPFLLGAGIMAWRFLKLPDGISILDNATLLGAVLWVFGFALGLVGAMSAVLARSNAGKKLGTALVVFGCSNLFQGIILRHLVEAGTGINLWLILIPVFLWFYAIFLAVKASNLEKN